MSDIQIIPIKALKDNYIWAIVNSAHAWALVVDPGEAKPVLDYLKQQQLQLKGILITHHHGDHTAGIEALIAQYPVPVFGATQSPCTELTHRVAEGDTITIETCFPNYRVMEIPGHTLDHIAYYADGHLFCGDTLFAAGCGRLFEGKAVQLYHSLQKIAALPKQTHIYCAHEYTLNNLRFAQIVEPQNPLITERLKKITTLREQGLPSLPSSLMEERQTNPFLRCEISEIVQQVSSTSQQMLTHPLDVFTALRLWKDNF